MMLVAVLLLLPIWSYSKEWGYNYSVIAGIAAIVLLFLILRSISYIEIESDAEGTSIQIERTHSKGHR